MIRTQLNEMARVLLLHTGGTLAMANSPRGYQPKAGNLQRLLSSNPAFSQPGGAPLTTPATSFGKQIQYEIIELDPLLDSSNMTMKHWRRLAIALMAEYNNFDGFVVLHGTDTMAYTASALSFMIQNLGKPIVLTGSQIPLEQMRSDGTNNLLGAMTIAAQFQIPEVGLFFDNKLYRGNRTQKWDTSGVGAFRSGNLPPLVEVGVDYTVHWGRIRPLPTGAPTLRAKLSPDVAAIRLIPGISARNLENAMLAPVKGVVLETFGSGNAPDNRPRFLTVLREAVERGVVIVNCTQCHRGMVTSNYAAGMSLAEIGVVPGADLTPEAALTKLAYLLATDLSPQQIRIEMRRNYAGEITV